MTPRLVFRITSTIGFLTLAIFMTVGYAYASQNTMAPTGSGDGIGTISGYEVGNISYKLEDDPSRVASVSFTLSAEANRVKIQLSTDQADWYDCTNSNSNLWTCTTPGARLKSADQLRVIASGN